MDLIKRWRQVRLHSLLLIDSLSEEDCVVQSMPDASPMKWHLAHTTWFFETFILEQFEADFQPFDPAFRILFNSYYNGVGQKYPRAQRGLLTRPDLEHVIDYRRNVDQRVSRLWQSAPSAALESLLELGLQHEQQHQELMLTDLKHLFSCNPLFPAYESVAPVYGRHSDEPDDEDAGDGHAVGNPLARRTGNPVQGPVRDGGFSARPGSGGNHEQGAKPLAAQSPPVAAAPVAEVLCAPMSWLRFDASLLEIGHAGAGFCFDNETPCHRQFVEPFELASRLVSNGEFLNFIDAGGYHNPAMWLAEGWDWITSQKISHPLYWHRMDGQWYEFTLYGLQLLASQGPVCHLSYFEAAAYAQWDGARLPTEAEWEYAAGDPAAGDPAAGDPAAGDPAVGESAAGAIAATDFATEAAKRDASGRRDANPAGGAITGVPGHLASAHAISAQTLTGGMENVIPLHALHEQLPPHPRCARLGSGLQQLFEHCWQWTSSSYAAYPGFATAAGALGEYNGKFMVNQYVLRGSSCFTPAGHARLTYRNFFPATARWQMTGIRLARSWRQADNEA